MAMKLYMTPGSCSMAIHILLEELEEVFEAYIVNLPAGDHRKPEYLAINPKGTIPALVRDDGSVLTELQAIVYWLARTRARGKHWPEEIEAQTRAVETMAYVVGEIHGQGFARIFAPGNVTDTVADQEAVRAAGRRKVIDAFGVLSARMDEEDFVAGAFSAVDPVLFYVEFWADKTAIPLPPKVLAHYRRMLARPAVVRVLREEGYDPAALGAVEAPTAAAHL